MQPARDFDEVLNKVGCYGKYQVWFTALIIVPTSFVISVTVNVKFFNFLTPEDYWCHVDGRNATNFNTTQWRALTIPKDATGNFDKCSQFNISHLTEPQLPSNRIIQECSQWDHNELQVEKSIPTQYGWYCDRQHYSAQVLSVALAGNAVGTFFFPLMADRFTGRRLMFFILLALYMISSFLTLLVGDVKFFMVLYFIRGAVFQANYQMPYVIGLELMSPDKRAVTSFFSFVAWTMGMCFTALTAWVIPNWINLTLLSCALMAPGIGLWWIMPESPRWLLSKGKISECTDILIKVAETNGNTSLKREVLEKELKSIHSEAAEGQLYQKFFQHKRLAVNCILLMIQSVAVFMAYISLVINVKILPDNYYLSFFILSISELPSNVAGWLSVQYLGRKLTAVITYVVSILLCTGAIFVFDDKVALICFAALLKFAITSGIFILYIMTSEVFPTPIRSTGMGLVVVCGMAGSAFSPYLVEYNGDGRFQYWCIMGLSAISMVMAIFLPETLGLPLPQTFAQSNNLNSNRPISRWINHWNKNAYLPVPKSEKLNESNI